MVILGLPLDPRPRPRPAWGLRPRHEGGAAAGATPTNAIFPNKAAPVELRSSMQPWRVEDEKWSVLPAFACFAVGGWVWARFQLRGLTLRRPQEGVERGQGGVGPGAQLGLGLSAENGQPSARRVIRSLSSPIQPTTTKPAMSLSQAASAIKQAVAPTFSSSSSSLVRQALISQG